MSHKQGFSTWVPPDTCANIFQRIASYSSPNINIDNSNVNVYNIQGKICAATEQPWMLEMDKDTLETIKSFNARKSSKNVFLFVIISHEWLNILQFVRGFLFCFLLFF